MHVAGVAFLFLFAAKALLKLDATVPVHVTVPVAFTLQKIISIFTNTRGDAQNESIFNLKLGI